MPQAPDVPSPAAAKLPATLDFLGGAPLTLGDKTSAYDTLLARIFASVRPSDPLEEIWVRQVGDEVWEAVRNRRLKAALMTVCAHQGVAEVLDTLQVPKYFELAKRWGAREPAAIAEVDARLAAAGLSMDHVLAHTLRRRIKDFEHFDRLITIAETRRNVALREIASYRAHFAGRLRRAAQEADTIEDVEFSVVAPAAAQQIEAGASAREPAEAVA
jgi:hypothetical protein